MRSANFVSVVICFLLIEFTERSRKTLVTIATVLTAAAAIAEQVLLATRVTEQRHLDRPFLAVHTERHAALGRPW